MAPPYVGQRAKLSPIHNGQLDTAQVLIDMMATYNIKMVLLHGMPTLEARGTKNYTRPDNVFLRITISLIASSAAQPTPRSDLQLLIICLSSQQST